MDGTTRKPLHLLVTKDTEHLSEVEKKIERENHRKVVAATTAV
ncbi:MAG: hypothetical protein VZR02_02775 [Lachnospiraceae bacterium]|nr:hypothetical protein [Lachnospiraceae bacterium]